MSVAGVAQSRSQAHGVPKSRRWDLWSLDIVVSFFYCGLMLWRLNRSKCSSRRLNGNNGWRSASSWRQRSRGRLGRDLGCHEHDGDYGERSDKRLLHIRVVIRTSVLATAVAACSAPGGSRVVQPSGTGVQAAHEADEVAVSPAAALVVADSSSQSLVACLDVQFCHDQRWAHDRMTAFGGDRDSPS